MEGAVFCTDWGQRLVLVTGNATQPDAEASSSPSPSGGVSLELTNAGSNRVRVVTLQ